MTMFKPQTYNSLTALREANVLEAHSDTTYQGIDVFGYFEGNAYEAQYVYDEISEATYAVAGDCIDEEPPVVQVPHYKVWLADHRNSQYFRGHHLPVVQVMVDGNTTYQELMVELLNWQNTDHIQDLDWDAYQDAIDELFGAIKADPSNKVFPDMEVPTTEEEMEEWDCYAFFVVEMEEEGDE